MIENLTKRELEVLKLISDGLTNEEISDKLCMSPHTTKTHLCSIYNKLGLSLSTSKNSVLRVRVVLIYLKESTDEKQKDIELYKQALEEIKEIAENMKSKCFSNCTGIAKESILQKCEVLEDKSC